MSTSSYAVPDSIETDAYEIIQLNDGRELAFTEWGDRDGFPAFYFHGTPSSRLEGAFADQAGKTHGVRLIATDRPGFGRSDFQKKRVFSDWPKDVLQLADHLGLDEFGVVGHSGAGPHLFVCGALIDPARLKFVGALGPWAPVATAEIMASLNSADRAYANISRRMPWIMHASFAPIGWAARHWQSLFFSLMKKSVSPADKHILESENFFRLFQIMELEAFRQGSKGAAHEASLAYGDWGFEISEIQVPTFIWLGKEDIFVPPRMGEYMQAKIPNVDLNMVDGKGHFNIENWDDILWACMTQLRDGQLSS
ncbi:MAG: alpha/beta hydrolase [Hyphomonadaceae bacterium]|nr:alpha/beta hydrolase [Hyphomonadaceae bacterium]